jgi:hypothetical protein
MATMKTTHWVIITLTIVGVLYAWHMWSTHGSFKSFTQGLGVNR